MACVQNLVPMHIDSEMEEGEIVDDLSDISSEEEFLLRQRLEVLENYNNVLERKKAKRSSVGPGKKQKKKDVLSYDLSEISTNELEDYCSPCKTIKVYKPKTYHKQKRKKDSPNEVIKNKDHKKKTSRNKRKLEVVNARSDSSEEFDEEYRNRRRKLADAVVVNKTKSDKTSLSERLQKMLCGVNPEPLKIVPIDNNNIDTQDMKLKSPPKCSPISSQNTDDNILCSELQNDEQDVKTACEVIDICTDEESGTVKLMSVDTVESAVEKNDQGSGIQETVDDGKCSNKDSDDDLESLRQLALKTKTVNIKRGKDSKSLSEDEDSDTSELRMICLKSALLKKAIAMKRKQKLQKKLSQSSSLKDDTFDHIMNGDKMNSDNNTDIESVDMDMGSDVDDKLKENDGECVKNSIIEQTLEKSIPGIMVTKEDELEEDEDLLRARLLTSLSKNLPNLVNPTIIKSIESIKGTNNNNPKQTQPSKIPPVPEEKRFIINVESDSEGEHEATKNLTKMHIKLSEQIDFQQKLDMFLKSTRLEVEKTALPDVVQQPALPKKNEKYVAKAVKNLPKSEQIEYKNLVKRMAELEKFKQMRQSTMNLNTKVPVAVKDTLKPRNVTSDASNLTTLTSLEEKIKISRKNIADESAKMLKLKDEGTKLSQKFKIVATELHNLKTAITLNKKQQRSVQNSLSKIRLHHQMLLKSSLTSTHSKPNAILHSNHVSPKLQKENNPKDPDTHKEYSKQINKNPALPKATKIGLTNDLKQPKPPENNPKPLVIHHPRLSIEVDVAKNKKTVTVPNNDEGTDKSKDTINTSEDLLESKRHSGHHVVEEIGCYSSKRTNSDDYKSPLDAFGSTTWEEDPNAILCPFEVFGDCKDTDCKYLHTKPRSI